MGKKLVIESEEYLWKERRRRLGLPLSFTKYQVSNERIIVRHGFLKTVTDEVMVYRIMDIRLVQSLWQKIFGVGTVTLVSTDKTEPTLELKNIKHSEKVRRFLSNLIEKQRIAKGITGSEFLGGPRPGHGGHGGHGHMSGGM